jgi:hypothetical protein
LLGFNTYSQSKVDNRFTEKILVKSDTLILKKSLLLHSSVYVTLADLQVLPQFYRLESNQLILDSVFFKEIVGSSIVVSYKFYDLPIKRSYATIDSTRLARRPINATQEVYILSPDALKQSKLIDGKNIEYNGSFARGFSVGNTQSLVVNSKFDLQLQGEIGNGIKINAAISDDNVPIQVEGNTQVLQEFDRVFIELAKNKTQLIAGDYAINRPNSYFMNYYKKLKGIGLRNTFDTPKSSLTSSVNVANSRGKFARQTILNKEGNQGPYKLQGNANERFIIVLSGTEKIYFNGQLIKRGQEYDYIIDYNLGEVTFNSNKIVAKESRIIVEFEYTDQNYYRTLYTASADVKWQNSRLVYNFYSEQDSKSSTSQIKLDSLSRKALQDGGDDEEKYIVSNVRAANVEEQAIKYEILSNPQFPKDKNEYFLQFSNDANKQLFFSSFSEVGQGIGSYIIDQTSSVNGRIYKFVGFGNGNYEPVTKVIPPEQKQMMDVSYDINLKKFGNFSTNLALTLFDKNRLSSIGDNDNMGLAGLFNYDNAHTLTRNKNDSLRLIYSFSSELNNDQFKPLNQYRDAEFNRDWNYKSNTLLNDRIYVGQIGLESKAIGFALRYNSFKSSSIFEGQRFRLNLRLEHKGLSFIAAPSLLKSSGLTGSTSFLRPNFLLSQTLGKSKNLQLGVELESEDNVKQKNNLDLDSSSYKFYYIKSFISLGDSRTKGIRLSYNKRADDFASPIALENAINIDEYELNAAWAKKENSQLIAILKYRNFDVVNSTLAKNEKSKRTLLGSINYNLTLWKNAIIFANNYQVNSGQTPKLEFVFQKIENLRGEYVYIGSDTATVKNINDFRFDPTNPLAQYTRFSLANNEFTTTNNVALNQSIRIEPSRYFKFDSSASLIKKLVSKLSNNSILRINNQRDANNATINYLDFSSKDTTTVSYQKNIVITTLFNRGNADYDISHIFRSNGAKTNQINGFEDRSLIENEWKLRVNLLKNTDAFLSYTSGNRLFTSKLFRARDLDLDLSKISAEINYRYSTKMRVGVKFNNSLVAQSVNNKETTRKQEYILAINRREVKSASVDLNFSVLNIAYKGAANSPIQYDLLEGFQPGVNYTWGLNLTKRIKSNIDLTIVYDGRKAGVTKTINVGRMQLKINL